MVGHATLGQLGDADDAGWGDGIAAWEMAEILTRSSISHTALEQMEHATDGYAICYPASRPGDLLPAVNAQLRRLHLVLAQPQTLAIRRRAVRLVGVPSGIRGNLMLDLDRGHDAAAAFAIGKLAGAEAEVPDLSAWVLATESIGAFFAARHQHVVVMLEEPARHAAQGSSARRRAWIAAFLARAYAAIGDAAKARGALDAAYAAISMADAPRGTDFFDPARLEGIAGTSYLLLRDAPRAHQTLTAARSQRAASDAKGRALLTLDLAACRLLEDEGDEACRLIADALELAIECMVEPILVRARSVRAQIGHAASTAARAQLDSRLTQLAP